MMPPAHSPILIVDDDAENRELLAEALATNGYEARLASGGEEACRMAEEQEFGAVVSDIQMGAISGIEMLKWFRKHVPETPVVLVTAFGSVETAIEAMKQGAFDYVTKPIHVSEFLMIVRRALDHQRLVRENRELRAAFDQRIRATSIVAQSRRMVEIFKLVGKVAQTKSSVLIYGETGTGKELIARAVHDNSPRASRPFVAINCSALPDNLLESELFGHVRGAFTNADRPRRGLLEESSGGTVFLDEISDLSPIGQAKLLRVLQEGEIRRLGSNTTMKVDLRVVSASRRDLEQAVKSGGFRDDLLYRLKTVTIPLPPLRERKEDIPLLADLFMVRYAGGKDIRGFSTSARDVLMGYEWPGNVRELEHVIERTVALAAGPIISAEDLPRELGEHRGAAAERDQPATVTGSRFAIARRKAAAITREELLDALNATRGNKLHTAQVLGISRWAINRLMDKYALSSPADDTAT